MTDGAWWTEAEWLACDDPSKLVDALEKRSQTCRRARSSPVPLLPPTARAASTRLLRLGLAAALRLLWDDLSPETRAAVEVLEGYADGAVPHTRVTEAKRCLWSRVYADAAHDETVREAAGWDAARLIRDALDGTPMLHHVTVFMRKRSEMLAIIRDIFGNPFRPLALDPTWLTPAVTAIAQRAYRESTIGLRQSLADALHNAGCESPDILSHCRSESMHVKGCWVVDMLLHQQ
jgi:hypothetical protein